MNNTDPETTTTRFRWRGLTTAAMLVALGFLALAYLGREGVLNRLRMLGQPSFVDRGAPPVSGARDSGVAASVVPQLSVFREQVSFGLALDAVAELARALSGPTFDVAQQARMLGNSVDATFAFVRDEIDLQIYSGVLRGARGTLLARSGNAFDRSVLLGALLGHHGHEVRYVRGRLGDEQAARLTERALAWDGPRWPQLDTVGTTLPGAEGAGLELANATGSRWIHNLRAMESPIVARMSDLGSGGVALKEILIGEARDHLWLEVRQGDQWIALDPAVSGGRPGDTLAQAEERHVALPASAFHYVTVRYVVEEQSGEQFQNREILSRRLQAADLADVPVALTYRVTGAATNWSASPVLTVAGDSVTGAVVASSGIDEGVQGLGRSILGGLGGAPGRAAPATVTAHWLEVDFADPSGKTETVQRELSDRIGALARTRGMKRDAPAAPFPEEHGRPLYLGNVYGLSFSTGPLPPGVDLAILARHLSSLRAIDARMTELAKSGGNATPQEMKKLGDIFTPIVPDLVAFVAKSFHVRSTARQGLFRHIRGLESARFYEASPRLAIASLEGSASPVGNDKVVLNLDLRRNDLRAIGRERSPRLLAWANLARGVLDAAVEDVFMNAPGRGAAGSSTSAAAVLARGADAGGLVLLASPSDVAAFGPPDDAQGRMIRNLSDGVVLLAPRRVRATGSTERLAWWRIDLRSGETLAVMDSGLHQGSSELGLQLGAIAAATAACLATGCRVLVWMWVQEFTLQSIIDVLTTGSVGTCSGPWCQYAGSAPPVG